MTPLTATARNYRTLGGQSALGKLSVVAGLLVAIAMVLRLLLPGTSGPLQFAPTLKGLQLAFEPNVGQSDPAVRFLAHTPGGVTFFAPTEIVMALDAGAQSSRVLRTRFLGAASTVETEGIGSLPGKVNYMIGNDPARWQTNVPTYEGVRYVGLYPGVSLIYSGDGGQLKSTFLIAAGSEPKVIRWQYQGAQQVWIDDTGNLCVLVSGGDGQGGQGGQGVQDLSVTEHAPVAWQDIGGKRTSVSVSYQLDADGSVSFLVGKYDPAYPITLDPTLTYSSYLGGSGTDIANDVAVGPDGKVYVSGETTSTDFPQRNPYPYSHSIGGRDAFVAKFDVSATGDPSLLFSTYLGGSGYDRATDIAVDSAGNAYVTGVTDSNNSGGNTPFPNLNAYQATNAGGFDAFIAKLSTTGSSLLYSSYHGATGNEWEPHDNNYDSGIAVDGSQNAYITGMTKNGTGFPIKNSLNGQSTYRGGDRDAFVAKVNTLASGWNSLVYSTYLGGMSDEVGGSIKVNSQGNAYVVGSVYPCCGTPTFPTTPNAFQTAHTGWANDFFLSVLTFDGSTLQLLYSSYLGGNGYDNGLDVWLKGDNALLSGSTNSANPNPLFTTANAYQQTHQGGYDAFIAEFDPSQQGANSLRYASYLGGSADDWGRGVALDGAGSVYLTGYTPQGNFPLANERPCPTCGLIDAFVTKLSYDSTSTQLVYSTRLGGASDDYGLNVAVGAGPAYNAYIVGRTSSSNFPTVNAYQDTAPSPENAFIAELNPATPTPTRTPTPSPTPTCANPTPFPHPWCPIAPTATASPTSPSIVSSYYVQPTHTSNPAHTPTPSSTPGFWWNQGFKVADSMVDEGPLSGLAILGFGKPDVVYISEDLVYRARVLGDWDPPIYVTLDEIQELAGDFASGFHKRASSASGTPPHIVIGIGTTNYWSPGRPLTTDEFFQHGYHWGEMIEALNTKYSALQPITRFEGAYDIEFAWSDPEYALRWTQGFELATRAPCSFCREYYYFVYGSCDDCYYPGSSRDPNDTILRNLHPEAIRTPTPGVPTSTPIAWTLDEAVGVTLANRAAHPLPQIYYPAGRILTDQAGQWAWLSSYAATHHICLPEYGIPRGIPGRKPFHGAMADGSGGVALPPTLAWQRLWMALDAQACTMPGLGEMQYLTPIRSLPWSPPSP